MKKYRDLQQYSVFEINRVLEDLGENYDIVRLVDIEECRTLEVGEDGMIHHGGSCFSIWNREHRCANCSSYRACMTHLELDKMEHLGHDREQIHSIPIYLETINGEIEHCVIECVNYAGTEGKDYQVGRPEEYVTSRDILTQLYTQEILFHKIRQRLMDDPREHYLIAMINIRNFAVINRLFGIEGGNRLLTGIAQMLRDHCGPEEIYGRYRSDRFVLLIKKDRYDEAFMAARLQEAASLVSSPIFSVQVKMGVYAIEDGEMSVTTMVEHAQMAVNSIRNAQDQDIAWYVPAMNERRLRDRQVVADFAGALESGEFQVYLQPLVRGDGHILGGEALARWIRPDGSLVMPGEFIAVLQQSELLSHLDVYIWEKAVQILCRWKGTPLERLFLSVNVDPTDFYYLDVPQVLGELCDRYAVPRQKLRVEITEAALVEDVERQGRIVDRLHEMGFLVEIDDFGKGYSSLSLLKDIHADVLKIDMGFVREGSNTDRSEVILDSVIEMAENLKMTVITEGVETKAQVDRLTQLGCHDFQGFYFSRPIPASDFEMVARAGA